MIRALPDSGTTWRRIVEQSSGAGLPHAPEWLPIIQRAYGHDPFYLSAEDDQGGSAVLPAFVVRRPFLGAVVTSMPFLDSGGPCGSSPALSRILIEHLIAEARGIGAKLIELRCSERLDIGARPSEHKVNMTLTIPDDVDCLWRRLDKDVRYQIRKAERDGVTAESGGAERLGAFYDVFAVRMRELGSPVHSQRFLAAGPRTVRRPRQSLARAEGTHGDRRPDDRGFQGPIVCSVGLMPEGILFALSEHASVLGSASPGLHGRVPPLRLRTIDSQLRDAPLQAAVGSRGGVPLLVIDSDRHVVDSTPSGSPGEPLVLVEDLAAFAAQRDQTGRSAAARISHSMTPQRLSERSLRVAFIGAGQMARNHLAAIQRLTVPAKLVGVTDCAPRAADQFAALAGIRPSFSIATLLAETRPDVVHVCTPPSSHFEAAYAALDYGAHVYVEKPFALTADDGNGLITLARARRRLMCAGHQLLRDDAFEKLMSRVPELGTVVQVDSHFAFRPARASWGRAGARALAAQAIDILPHPLYTLVDVLERFGTPGAPVELTWALAGSSDLQAVLRAGDVVGRLSVSLRARPVASSLMVTGTRGSLTCDFVRSTLAGTANSGTEALEKILNPMVEGWQLASRTVGSLARRLRAGGSYAGLQPLIEAFYQSIVRDHPSPIAPAAPVAGHGSLRAIGREDRGCRIRAGGLASEACAVEGCASCGRDRRRRLPRRRDCPCASIRPRHRTRAAA